MIIAKSWTKIVQHVFYCMILTSLLSTKLTAQDLNITGDGTKIVEIDKTVVIKQKVNLITAFPAKIQAPSTFLLYVWQVPSAVHYIDSNDSITITSAVKGDYTIKVNLVNINFETKKVERKTAEVTFTVGDTPDPKPPIPPVPPPPSPIPADGNRVIIFYESGTALPSKQQLILTAQEIRTYLNSKCALGPDSKTKEWRIWDKDVDASGESVIWQNAVKHFSSTNGATVPWIMIAHGKDGGFEGPLPSDIPATLELLKKYLEPPSKGK